jgi:hypothetical protein
MRWTLQALNVLMLKILENSNRNYTFSALLSLLLDTPKELTGGPVAAPGAPQQLQQARWADLVVKCLIKSTKALPQVIEVRASMPCRAAGNAVAIEGGVGYVGAAVCRPHHWLARAAAAVALHNRQLQLPVDQAKAMQYLLAVVSAHNHAAATPSLPVPFLTWCRTGLPALFLCRALTCTRCCCPSTASSSLWGWTRSGAAHRQTISRCAW